VSWFRDKHSKFYNLLPPEKRDYKTPERITRSDARQRRLDAELLREAGVSAGLQAAIDERNRRRGLAGAPVSGYKKKISDEIQRFLDDATVLRQKVDSRSTARSKAFVTALARERALSARLTREGFEKAKAAAADKRQFNPQGKDFASTVHGTQAAFGYLSRGLGIRRDPLGAHRLASLPSFLNPTSLVPCIQRQERREVLFAKGKGGRGYKGKKRRTFVSGIIC
jgi:hypothetical protein